MPGAYLIVLYTRIEEPDRLGRYAELAGPAIEVFGGRIVAKGAPAKAYEKGAKELSVLVAFDSIEAATGMYESDAYQKSLDALGARNIRDVRILPVL